MISGSQTRLRLEQTISLGRLDRLDSTYTTDSIHIQVINIRLDSTYTTDSINIQVTNIFLSSEADVPGTPN